MTYLLKKCAKVSFFLAILFAFMSASALASTHTKEEWIQSISETNYTLLQNLGTAKAEKRIIGLQEKELEKQKQIGSITFVAYEQQKFDLRQQKRDLDAKEDQARLQLIKTGLIEEPMKGQPQVLLTENQRKEALEKKYRLDRERDAIEVEIKVLQGQYQLNQIEKNTFVEKVSELEAIKEIIEKNLRPLREELRPLKGPDYRPAPPPKK